MKKYSISIACIGVLLFLYGTAHATTWYVHPDSTLNCIQDGLDSCATNDTVLVGPGTYYENIVWPNMQAIHLISEYGKDTTLIDGDSTGCVIDISTSVDTTTVIDGFTIQNGYASGGGGIYCSNSSPSLTNVTISENTATSAGGGIYCSNSSPSLTNVTISENTASGGYDTGGGGIYCSNSSPSLTNVTISGNYAGSPGGSEGGGICCWQYSNPSLTNVTISENTSNMAGGGIFCGVNSSPSLTNVTISGNTASGGGGIYCSNSSPSLVNCILWNDTPQEIMADSVTVTYSDIEGGWPGVGNIDTDPMFVSGPLSEYHLSLSSPCIDTGNPSPQYNDPEDPLNPGYALWPALGTVRNDMGVYGGPGAVGWVGIEEQPAVDPVIESNTLRATIHAGHLILPEDKKCRIFDITGRVVMPDNIKPGIYFIEIDGKVIQKVVKIK